MGTTTREKILLETEANQTALVSLLVQESKADLEPLSLVEIPWHKYGK